MKIPSILLKKLVLSGCVLVLMNLCFLSSSQVDIPEWMAIDVAIRGDLKINHDNYLMVSVKPLADDLEKCEIEPISDDRAIYFYPLEKKVLNLKKGKSYQLAMKFRILDNVKNRHIGAKLRAYYPVGAIISMLKQKYPYDSINRQGKIDYLMSRQGKIAEFSEYLDVSVDKFHAYTSRTGLPSFYIREIGSSICFDVLPSSDYERTIDGISRIDSEIKDKLAYCELLKDPDIKNSLSDDPGIERRNVLKRIFELKFQKLLVRASLSQKDLLEDIDKFIEDFQKTRILDRHFWREVVCFYLFQKINFKSADLNPVIREFLELRLKDWNLSFVYYNYAVFLNQVKNKTTQAVKYLKLATELNPYLHIAKKLLENIK